MPAASGTVRSERAIAARAPRPKKSTIGENKVAIMCKIRGGMRAANAPAATLMAGDKLRALDRLERPAEA
ncbi:hypothetical protein GCM10007908_00280 [Rhizobium albus]|nr:hypothetical protein GCM10007908_00280 [Rhizobium albus]